MKRGRFLGGLAAAAVAPIIAPIIAPIVAPALPLTVDAVAPGGWIPYVPIYESITPYYLIVPSQLMRVAREILDAPYEPHSWHLLPERVDETPSD